MSGALTRLLTRRGRIRYRILAVNLLGLLVPVAGLEFARIYERQLLRALEQDMRNQAALVRHQLEADPSWLTPDGAARYGATLAAAARDTRTRIRVLDAEGQERVDSHDRGPPEGPEKVLTGCGGGDAPPRECSGPRHGESLIVEAGHEPDRRLARLNRCECQCRS